MAGANLINDRLLGQIEDLIRKELKTGRTSTEDIEKAPELRLSGFPFYAVILDTAMAAPDSFLDEPTGSTNPSAPNATICLWSKADNKYVQTVRRLAVCNHSSTSHEEDTPGAAILIDGHYWFFGDCLPMSNRPTPPWDEE